MLMLIFGLTKATTNGEVRRALGFSSFTPVLLQPIPGEGDSAWAMVHLHHEMQGAREIADRVNRLISRGRRLEAWIPVMPWSR